MDANANIKKNKEVYDKISDQFAGTRKFLWQDLVPLIQYTKAGYRILDLGCGTGRLYQLFEKFQPADDATTQGVSREHILYTGVDNSIGQITEAKKQYSHASFDVGDMTDLPYSDDAFDAIYAIASFHHLGDKKTRLQALKEMQRVLVMGGTLIMTNWNLTGEWGKQKIAHGDYREIGNGNIIVPWKNPEGVVMGERLYHSFTEEELRTLLEEAGFTVKDQYFTKHGEKKNHAEGMNLVTIATL